MRKIIIFLLALCILFCFTSCKDYALFNKISGQWYIFEECKYLTELECYSSLSYICFMGEGKLLYGGGTYTITEDTITINFEEDNYNATYTYNYSITGRMLELQYQNEESILLLSN